MLDTVGSNRFVTSQTRAPPYKTTLCPTSLLSPVPSPLPNSHHHYCTFQTSVSQKACVIPKQNMPLSGRFFCLKGYGLLAALANSYKASKACLCRFENLPYLLYPLLPWEELTSPVLGPSGHGPHSNLWCIRRQGPPRSKDTGTESALSPCVKVHDRKAGKKTLNVQCTRETDLKHIQSNETDRQANKLISSQNYPFFPQDNNLVFPPTCHDFRQNSNRGVFIPSPRGVPSFRLLCVLLLLAH